jgi:DNA-binding CsgD family transcriptional regulator
MPDLYGWFCIRRVNTHGIYSGRDIRTANRLAFHLGRIIKLQTKFASEVGIANCLRQSLDLLSFGIFIVDVSGKVLIGNRAAEAILRKSDGLGLHQGHLICDRPDETATLRRAILSVSQGQENQNSLKIDFYVTRRVAERPLTVYVAPVNTVRNNFTTFSTSAAAVFAIDPFLFRPDIEGIAKTYGLTAAERLVLREIVQCSGLVEAARKLRLAVPPARTHLQHIFAKTDTNSQAGLVRLVMTSPLANENL